jgi:hypothetical protein
MSIEVSDVTERHRQTTIEPIVKEVGIVTAVDEPDKMVGKLCLVLGGLPLGGSELFSFEHLVFHRLALLPRFYCIHHATPKTY